MESAIYQVIATLIAAAVATIFYMWRDIAVLKRDVDALALLIGTKRAKARCKNTDK